MRKSTWEWTAAKEKAARSVAEGVLTETEIAKTAGVHRSRISVWKTAPEFAERVKVVLAELAEVSRQRSIGRREDRVEAQNQRWIMLREELEKRKDELSAVELAVVIKELREHEKEASIETGQRTEKRQLSGPDGGAIPIQVIEVRREVVE